MKSVGRGFSGCTLPLGVQCKAPWGRAKVGQLGSFSCSILVLRSVDN